MAHKAPGEAGIEFAKALAAPDPFGLAAVQATARHPLGFYRRRGFEMVGLILHANGFGAPDILHAKRLT